MPIFARTTSFGSRSVERSSTRARSRPYAERTSSDSARSTGAGSENSTLTRPDSMAVSSIRATLNRLTPNSSAISSLERPCT